MRTGIPGLENFLNNHIELLLDGVCKHRCLFIDYDDSFIANDYDYEVVKTILTKMIKSWDTSFKKKVLV